MKQMTARSRFKFRDHKNDLREVETNQLRKNDIKRSRVNIPVKISKVFLRQKSHANDNILRNKKAKPVHKNQSETSETRPQNRPVDTKGYAQFVSVFFIISTLFGIVFFHMEIRRLGYTILTLSQDEKQVRDKLRTQIVSLAKVTGPERIQNVAQTRFPLKRAEPGQIIQMTQQGHAVTQ